MRNIFITVNDGSIARNILRSFVLAGLLEKPDISIGLITHESKREAYRREFGRERVRIFGIPQRRLTFFERVLSYLIRNGLRTKTILMDQRTHIDGRYAAFVVKRLVTYIFGGSKIFHALVRLLFLLRKPAPAMQDLFLRERPDLLFSTDVQAELDFDAMAAARQTGTKIIGMVRSWDNLTARGGLVPYVPEKLLVWDPYLYRQAMDIQHISGDCLIVIGIPQFDWYVKKELIKPREEFLKKFGIDPSKRVILFAGEGAFHAPHEVEVLEMLSEAIRTGKIKDSARLALIFRPHPAFGAAIEQAKKFNNVIVDEGISLYTGKDRSSWEMDREKIYHLVNSLYHANLVVTTASTMAIDAAAFDKPVVCVAFDGKSKEPYWNSVSRYYRDYTHYADLSKTGGFKIAYSAGDMVRFVNEYLDSPMLDALGRQKIRDEFIWKLDGKSAERIAGVLLGGL